MLLPLHAAINKTLDLSSIISPNHQNPALDQLRPGGAWDAYIRVRDVRSLCDSLRQKMSIRRELCPMPYGELEFELRDPNGYVLVFAEHIV